VYHNIGGAPGTNHHRRKEKFKQPKLTIGGALRTAAHTQMIYKKQEIKATSVKSAE
jgi:hypothetical protein